MLWKWTFKDKMLNDIEINGSDWQELVQWLEAEEKKAFSEYPPDQLKAMREFVNKHTYDPNPSTPTE